MDDRDALLTPIQRLRSQSRFNLVMLSLVSIVLIANGASGLLIPANNVWLNISLILVGTVTGVTSSYVWVYRSRHSDLRQ